MLRCSNCDFSSFFLFTSDHTCYCVRSILLRSFCVCVFFFRVVLQNDHVWFFVGFFLSFFVVFECLVCSFFLFSLFFLTLLLEAFDRGLCRSYVQFYLFLASVGGGEGGRKETAKAKKKNDGEE